MSEARRICQAIATRVVPPLPEKADGVEAVLDHLVRAGAQAPSWYNEQPWRFMPARQRIDVVLEASADRTLYDWGLFHSLTACGAAVRNIEVAARRLGVHVRTDFAAEPADRSLVGSVIIDPDRIAQADEGHEALERAVWIRHMNTQAYSKQPLQPAELHAISASIAADAWIGLQLFADPADKTRIFQAAASAERLRFARRDLHEQLHRMIRWSEKDALTMRTGFSLPSMGVCGFGKQFFRASRPWASMRLLNLCGAHVSQARRACMGLENCAAIGVLTMPGSTSRDLVQAGAAMEALWLTATSLGLSFQPHSALLLFQRICTQGGAEVFQPHERQVLRQAFQAFAEVVPSTGGHAALLFRIGRSVPMPGYTLRKDPLAHP